MSRISESDRLAYLEQRVATLEAEARGGRADARLDKPLSVRWAKTVNDSGSYPAATSNPNAYPFVLLDGDYTNTAGAQSVTFTARQTSPRDVVCNVAPGNPIGTSHYIPVNTVIPVWQQGARWWTFYLPANVIPANLSGSSVASGASGNITLADGRSVLATNVSGQTLTAGAVTAYWYNGAWYMVGARASGGGGGGAANIWHGIALARIMATATGAIQLADMSIIGATNWSNTTAMDPGDKIIAWEDPLDSTVYCAKIGDGCAKILRGYIYNDFTTKDASCGFRIQTVQQGFSPRDHAGNVLATIHVNNVNRKGVDPHNRGKYLFEGTTGLQARASFDPESTQAVFELSGQIVPQYILDWVECPEESPVETSTTTMMPLVGADADMTTFGGFPSAPPPL
jgi:hypothetical protein